MGRLSINNLHKKTKKEIKRIEKIPEGKRTLSEVAFLTARKKYIERESSPENFFDGLSLVSEDNQAEIMFKKNPSGGWDVLEIRKKGLSGGDNFTSVDIASYPDDNDGVLSEEVTDSAIIAKRIDALGNTEFVGLFSNGYPAGKGDSQIHGIEIQAYGNGANAKIRDFVFLWKDKTTTGDGAYHVYEEHKLADPADTKIVTHVNREHLIPLEMSHHSMTVGKAVCVTASGYYLTHAGSTHTGNQNYIGILKKVVDTDNFEIAISGSVIDLIVGSMGDKVYLDTSWGGLTTTQPSGGDAVIQVGVNVSGDKMLLI